MTLADAMYRDGYLCPLCDQLMGETAETLAVEYAISATSRTATRSRATCAARAWREAGSPPEAIAVTIGEGRA